MNRCLAANPQNPKTFDHSVPAARCDRVALRECCMSRAFCIIVVVLAASASIMFVRGGHFQHLDAAVLEERAAIGPPFAVVLS